MMKTMEFKKEISYLFIMLLLTSCFGQEEKEVKMDPETQEAYDNYKKQEHRIAINGCNLSYNEIELYFDMGIDNLVQILGEYDNSRIGYTGIIYTWTKIGITLLVSNKTSVKPESLNYVNINFEEGYEGNGNSTEEGKKRNISLRKEFPLNGNYILINKTPLAKGQNMGGFAEKMGLSLDDFSINNSDGYKLEYDNCHENKKVLYYFTSEVKYENKGSGHLNYKGKGTFGKGTIRSLQVSIESND